MSLRLRLTLLYSAILALTLIGLGVVLYLTVSQVTLNTVETSLAEEAQRLVYTRPFRLDHIGPDPRRIADPETYIQTLRPDGSIVARAPNLGDYTLSISQPGLQACQNGQAWTEITATENSRLLVYYKPIVMQGQVTGIVQFARSLTEQDEALATLRNILIIGSLVVTILAFGIGWVLAGTALRPIHRIADTAQTIGANRDFDQRVDYTGPPDEVGRLATTFNAMLTELQAAYRQAEQSLQAQRRFVADASHELRTPLTTIRGNLGLLQRRPPIVEEDKQAVVADMVDETNRLIRLVNDLLVLARSDAGRPLRNEPVPLGPLLDDICRQAKLLGAKRIIECERVPEAAVVGDRDILKQVLLILLDNALKFTPVGGTITIGAAVVDGRVAIRLRDTGPGIAPEALPHIFERFYRADASRAGTSAGLGLAIARELVEAQQGTITVDSEIGQGSTFTVTLPLSAK
jgi:two-component system OmpR family sensor kinase